MMIPKRDNASSGNQRFTLADEVYGVERGLFDDALGQALLRNHAIAANDFADDAELLRRVDRARRREALGFDPPFRKPRLYCKELLLSQDEFGSYAGMPIDWLSAGLLFVGNTGSGKSTFIERLVVQLARYVQGLWLTDMYKTRLRHLRPIVAEDGRDLMVLTPRNLKINLLQAPGDPRQFVSFISDLLVRSLGMPPLAKTILPGFIHLLYKKFGIYEGRAESWPTLHDLYIEVHRAERINAQAKAAIIERLRSLLSALPPENSAYRRAWSPVDLGTEWIVFEMLGTSERVKSLVLSYYLFGLFLHDMSQSSSASGLKHWIAFEDAQRITNIGGDTGNSDMAPLEEIAGVIRESGRGLGIVVQSLHGFPRGLAANLATRVMGRTGTSQDAAQLGQDMGLSNEQIFWCKLNLRPGRFVGQVACGDWRHPFLINVPNVRIPRTVTDDEAAASVAGLDRLPVVRADEYFGWDPYETIAVTSGDAKSNDHLDDGAVRLLRAVIDHPGKPSSQYPRLVGMGARRVLRIRAQLVENGYLREHHVATSTTGRTAIVLVAQRCAYEALGLDSDGPVTADGADNERGGGKA